MGTIASRREKSEQVTRADRIRDLNRKLDQKIEERREEQRRRE